MAHSIARKPLDRPQLRDLALAYVGRYATTRAKLASYLGRKLRERGWADPDAAEALAVDEIVAAMVANHFVDDRAYADMKAQGMSRRGYGPRRVQLALSAAGIEAEDMDEALEGARQDQQAAALAFAKRRRIGPFSRVAPDQKQREKALAALLRAGHDFALARRILDLPPELVHTIETGLEEEGCAS
jgi:regulatory protein